MMISVITDRSVFCMSVQEIRFPQDIAAFMVFGKKAKETDRKQIVND